MRAHLKHVMPALLLLLPLGLLAAADTRDFSRTWTLDRQQSNLRGLPATPDDLLTVSRQGATFRCTESDVTWSFRADGTESKYRIKDSTLSTEAKSEGAALLINTLVGGPQNYVIEDRWELSKNGAVSDHADHPAGRRGHRGDVDLQESGASGCAGKHPSNRAGCCRGVCRQGRN